MTNKQIHDRGYLPYVNGADLQFITYRLHDSLPLQVFKSMQFFDSVNKQKAIHNYLDQGLGSCLLRQPENAKIVIENWKYFDDQRYDLHAYVVMLNHVHILIKVYPEFDLTQIVHSWKSFTAKKLQSESGQNIWYRDYYDRYIRDEEHYNRVVEYIRQNPIKAGLVKEVEDWPFLFVTRDYPSCNQ